MYIQNIIFNSYFYLHFYFFLNLQYFQRVLFNFLASLLLLSCLNTRNSYGKGITHQPLALWNCMSITRYVAIAELSCK